MRRTLPLLALATGLLALTGGQAAAEAPTRTAWFTALSAGPLTAPAPTLAEGDLRVAGTGERPTAYATLLLPSSGDGAGELVLAVREGSLGTAELAACPTRKSTWTAGGNQPFSQGPEYDCSTASAFGAVAADGLSVSFSLDSTLVASGVLSVAVVPLPESTAPFSVDLGDAVFTPAAASPGQEPITSAPDPTGPTPTGPTSPGRVDAPPLDAGSGAPALPDADPFVAGPVVAGVEAPVAPEDGVAEVPLTAPTEESAPADQPAVLPGAQLAAGVPDEDGPRLLALLTLVAISAGAGYAAGQQRPAPRLLGGRARAELPAGAAAGTAVVATRAPDALPRGIGRFSRLRDAAPRRLR